MVSTATRARLDGSGRSDAAGVLVVRCPPDNVVQRSGPLRKRTGGCGRPPIERLGGRAKSVIRFTRGGDLEVALTSGLHSGGWPTERLACIIAG